MQYSAIFLSLCLILSNLLQAGGSKLFRKKSSSSLSSSETLDIKRVEPKNELQPIITKLNTFLDSAFDDIKTPMAKKNFTLQLLQHLNQDWKGKNIQNQEEYAYKKIYSDPNKATGFIIRYDNSIAEKIIAFKGIYTSISIPTSLPDHVKEEIEKLESKILETFKNADIGLELASDKEKALALEKKKNNQLQKKTSSFFSFSNSKTPNQAN